MDQVSDKVGIMGLPEVFFGFNHLIVANKQYNILLDFNAVDSLSYSGFEKRKLFLSPNAVVEKAAESGPEEEKKDNVEALTASLSKMMLDNSGLTEQENSLNLIDLIPVDVQVQMAGHWKNKDTSKIKDYKEVEQTSDWTHSTPYKGTLRYLSLGSSNIRDQTSLEIDYLKEDAPTGHLEVT